MVPSRDRLGSGRFRLALFLVALAVLAGDLVVVARDEPRRSAPPGPAAVEAAVGAEDPRDGPVRVVAASGSGNRRTAAFRLSGADSVLSYTSGAATLTVFLVDARRGTDATAGFADVECSGPCEDGLVLVSPPGDYYLDVRSQGGQWEVAVEEYR